MDCGLRIAVVTTLGLFTGCGTSERDQYDVSGRVSFDGKPVPAGMILFEPDLASGSDGTQGYAEIRDGRFNTATGGRPTTGGAYVARIRGFEEDAESGGRPRPLFPEFRQPVDLPPERSTRDFDVPASAASGDAGVPFEPT